MTQSDVAKESYREPNSRPFDVHRWSDYPELSNCLSSLVDELEGYENRVRRRGDGQSKKFREAIRCLVLDLFVAWKTDPDLTIGISLGNSSYTDTSRYRALFIHWSSFIQAYRLLVQAGYIEVVHNGFHGPEAGTGRVTRIKATEHLIRTLTDKSQLTIPWISTRTDDMEIIILRDNNKHLLNYEDTLETMTMRNNLQRINTHLQNQWIDIRVTDSDFHALQRRMTNDHRDNVRESLFIDFTKRSLVRIFNNSDWQQGGRFYRGWWQSVPKEYRRYITINEKQTCELDYSTLHPHLLYAEAGCQLEGDAYDINKPAIPRDMIKTTFNKMLNTTATLREPANFSETQFGLDWKQFQQAIAERHAPIKQFFNKGYGLQLQRKDSDLAQSIILDFIDLGYTCLPIHDSFIVHHALADKLKGVMEDKFMGLTGNKISLKAIEGYEVEIDTESVGQPINTDIEYLLTGTGNYAGYDQRHIDWYLGISRRGRPQGPPSAITSANKDAGDEIAEKSGQ